MKAHSMKLTHINPDLGDTFNRKPRKVIAGTA